MKKLITAMTLVGCICCLCFSAEGGNMFTNLGYGYGPSGVKELFPAMLLISAGESAPKVVKGWVEKERHVYSGDRMPPGNYNDRWVVTGFRDGNKQYFGADTIVWDHRDQ